MPTFKNVSPKGDLELALHRQDDEEGNLISPARIVFVASGETVQVSALEAKVLDDTNWQLVKPPTTKAPKPAPKTADATKEQGK